MADRHSLESMIAAVFTPRPSQEGAAEASGASPQVGQIRYPLERRDIAQVWFAGGWQWAILREPKRGRPKHDPAGTWLGNSVFIPWHRGRGIGLGRPAPLPNTLGDALAADPDRRADRGQRVSKLRPFWFLSRRGRRRQWSDDRLRKLLVAVDSRCGPGGRDFQAALRSVAARKIFGDATASTLRRRYFEAQRKFRGADAPEAQPESS